MTADEFELAYAQRSKVTVEWLRAHGRVVRPCHCGEDGCEGWQSISQELADDFDERFGVGMWPTREPDGA